MKKLLVILGSLILTVVFSTQVMAGKVKEIVKPNKCATIQNSTLYTNPEVPKLITTGHDQWGYNYQAHMFKGTCDTSQGLCESSFLNNFNLTIRWSDAWLSNQDCDNDLYLDRHFGHDTYQGSGAWITNRQSGSYFDEQVNLCKWRYFVKVEAVPLEAYQGGNVDIYYTADDEEIGPAILVEEGKAWESNAFTITKESEDNTCTGTNILAP